MHKHKIMQKLIFGLLLFVLGNIIVQASHGASTEPLSVDDPWEKFNRKMFAFNESLDHHILKPVAVRYRTYTPKPVQGLINNFFNNLGDIRNFANALLQLKLKDASVSLTRFVINSTIGQLGFVDVASPIGLEKHYEDFGLTLAHWHIPSGPYLVLPLFGSGTVRSACGLVPDHYTYPPNYSRQFFGKSRSNRSKHCTETGTTT